MATLRYGGYVGHIGTYRVKGNSTNQRSSPYIRSNNVVRQLSAGTLFKNGQTTDTGQLVNGSRRWYGSSTGNLWLHSSVVTKVSAVPYRPTFRKQGDGSRYQWSNCNPASHAMAADRHRRGVDPRNHHGWKPTPVEIRNRLIAVYGDRNGTSLPQNDVAVQHLYLVNMAVRYNVPWSSFRSMIISGRGAVVPIKYSVIAPTKYDASPGFTGGHAVYVNERRSSDGRFLVYDPLADGRRRGIPKGPQWWPASLLQRAAYAYPGTNSGCIHASFTKDTEP